MVKNRAIFSSRSCLAFCVLAVFVLLQCVSSFCLASVPGVLSSAENAVSAACAACGGTGVAQRTNSTQKILALLRNSHILPALFSQNDLACECVGNAVVSDIFNLSSIYSRSVILRL